jgi:hypothetical protein
MATCEPRLPVHAFLQVAARASAGEGNRGNPRAPAFGEFVWMMT